MTPFTFHTAGSLLIGRGSLSSLGERLASLFQASRVFVVTDQNLVAVGITEQLVDPLRNVNIQVEVFQDCVAEPPSTVVERAADAARSFQPQAVIGLGGGSNIDTAKLVALLISHPGKLSDYVGDSRVPGPVVPLVAVPTTAGTGSEVSPAAVYTDVEQSIKVSCLSPYLRPSLALVDAALTDRCPQKVTADSGIDALTHAIEAYTACPQAEFLMRPGEPTVYQGKNPLADLCAQEAIRLITLNLEAAVNEPENRSARDQMALAATLGGLAFSNAGVALTHAMEYPVGGAVHVSHGAGNGLLLPHVMQYNATMCQETIASLGPLMGVAADWNAVVQKVAQLSASVGIPQRLSELGVTREMLPGFAEKAFSIRRLMRVNPRQPQSSTEIYQIYEAAF